jgi:hypothetical protein
MKPARTAVIAATLCVAGCAYPDARTRLLYDGMVGHSPADLVRTIGVPTQTLVVGGSQFLDYADTTTTFVDEPYFAGGFRGRRGFGIGGYGGTTTAYQDTCRTTFEVRGERIVGWKTHGC